MVNADMFKDAFRLPSEGPIPTRKEMSPIPRPAQVQVPQQPEDPDIAKLRFLMLKWLSIIIGGAAILLIVWRVILKFI